MRRFLRDYRATIQLSPTEKVVIKPPFRCAFDVFKSVAGGLNRGTFTFWGLNRTHRLALTKDVEDSTKNISVTFEVGYEDRVQQIFKGSSMRGEVTRDGADLPVELECLDGGFDFVNSFTSQTVSGKNVAIDAVLGDMPNTERGKITQLSELYRPRVLVGATHKVIDGLLTTDERWFIDNELLYILKATDVVSRDTPVVSPLTGLLNTPSREQLRVTFESQMNPTLRLGGLCDLRSGNAPHLNGVYRLDSMSYTGDTHGADWSMTPTGLLMTGCTVL